MGHDDNVTDVQMHRTAEFDAFGPWAMAVRTPDEVPRLFRQVLPDPTGAVAVVKIPRPISRRDANSSMDLYDHLLAAYDDRLELFSRAPSQADGIRTRKAAGADLVALETSVKLLDGKFAVRLLDAKPLVVHYNAVSKDVIEPLVTAVRRMWRAEDPTTVGEVDDGPVPVGLRDLGGDVALITGYREVVAAEPGMRLLGAHERRIVRPADAGALSRTIHRVWPMWLQGAVVCSDGVELQVLHRRDWWVRGTRPVHSSARTILPLDRATPVEMMPTSYEGVREMRVHGDAARFPIPAESPTERCLLDVLS